LTSDQVLERLTHNSRTLACDRAELVGNATIRPPRPGSATATVIVRILPGYRRQGLGSDYLAATLAEARGMARDGSQARFRGVQPLRPRR